MFAKIDASRPGRSLSVTFRDVHASKTVCMPHRITPLNLCNEIGLIKIGLQVCFTRVLMGHRDAIKKVASFEVA